MKNTYKLVIVLLLLGIISTALAASTPKIVDIKVKDITGTNAKITFTVDQADTDTVVQYGTTKSLGKWSDWDNSTGKQKQIILGDLVNSTKYYYVIYAYNGSDQKHFVKSSTLNFTTKKSTVGTTINNTAPEITDVNVGNINDTSAEVTFDVNQSDTHTIIRYGTTTSLNKRSDWNNNTGTSRSIKLSDLSNKTKYYYSIYAYNGTNSDYHTNSDTRDFTTLNADIGDKIVAKIISKSPSEKVVNTAENESINFTVTFDQTVNVTWHLNDTQVKKKNFVTSSYYFNDTSSIGTWNVTVKWSNKNGSDSYSWTWIAKPKTYGTGNRIWDGSKGMSTTYTWSSYSFAGFYYDINKNQGTEELTIRDIDRSIGEGDIIYKTSPIEVSFDYSNFGKYQVIGFMADKYFAGYTSNSTISDKEEISSLSSGQLHKVILDDENKRTVSVGGTLSLGEGYVLKMKEIDIGAGSGQIWVSLLKDGGEVDNGVLTAGDTYIYRKRVGSTDDLPIIAIHFDTVFRGTELNAVFVRGIFQISDSYTDIDSNSRYGKMEISSISKDQIIMNNRETVGLSEGDTIDLMGNLKIIVADSDELRFGLSVDRTGIEGSFEARGTIYPMVNEWTPLNFGLDVGGKTVGFYYDIDEDIGTEILNIKSINGRSIPDGGLTYSTSPQDVSFDYSGFGKYQVIGFMADKYFAGYTSNSAISDNKKIDIIGNGQLHKILLDDNNQRVISVGSTLTLKDGYVLKAKEVDIGAGTGQIWVVLLKDGNEVDDSVVSTRDNYVYKKKVGSVDDLPIIAVHVDSVFRGKEVNAAFIKGIFQISDSPTEINNGDTFGKMEVSAISGDQITMENKDDISLSSGSKIDIMGNIKLKVADSGSVRFYPYVLVTRDMIMNQLSINAPARATAGDIISINVTAGGIPIDEVSISIEPEIGLIDNKTNNNGIVNFTLPTTSKGTYSIIVNKLGYQKANKTIDIDKLIEDKLSINIPNEIDQFNTISIQVTSNNTLISDATITYDNNTIGLTDSNGAINYTLDLSGNHTISASKTGYIATAKDIYVREPYSEFKATDINTIPSAVFENDNVLIKSNITNIGTKADTKYIELIVNNIVSDNKSITISPKETKEISFKYKVSIPEGNYTVEILEQKKLLEIKEKPLNIFLIVGIITIIGAILIYFLTKDQGLYLNKLSAKLKR